MNMSISEKTRRQLSKDIQAIVQHSQNLIEATSGELDERTQAARERLKETLETVKGKYDALEERLHDGMEQADHYIKEKPYYAMGMTFAAGLLFGWILKKK